MRKKINLLFCIVIADFLVFWYLQTHCRDFLQKDLVILIAGFGIVTVLYMFNRFDIFNRKMKLALRHILENNFQTGISMPGHDEFSVMADDFNRAIDRINEYDVLRENKIVGLNRLIGHINRNISSGIMIFDLDSGRIKINRAAQEVLGIRQDDLSIDSVIKLESNNAFNDLYQDVVNGKANTIAADLELSLPILRAKADIKLKMFAIKDKDERLNSVLCVFAKA